MGHKKQTQEWLRLAERLPGWSTKKLKNGHIRVISPDGQFVVLSHTPGRGRAFANERAALRRLGFPIP